MITTTTTTCSTPPFVKRSKRNVSLPKIPLHSHSDAAHAAVPSSLQERLLSAIADTLNLASITDIALDDSFTDLGGDQRSARDLRRACHLIGIDVKIRDILRCHTLAELQTCVKPLSEALLLDRPYNTSCNSQRSSTDDCDNEDGACDTSYYDYDIIPDSHEDHPTSVLSSLPQQPPPIPKRAPTRRPPRLFEMESEILSHGAVDNAAIVRPKAGYFEGASVVFLTLNAFPCEGTPGREVKMLATEHMSFAGAQVGLLRQWIEETGHYSEHPQAWIVLECMPIVQATAKLDRRRLQTWIQNLNEDMYSKVMKADEQEAVVRPANEMERKIQHRISVALNIPEAKVGMNFSFEQLGGDSIAASQVAADCRSDLILLKQDDILRSNTISEMALLAHSRDESGPAWNEESSEPFTLSPMQQLYFQTTIGGNADLRARQDGTYRFNQSFLLRIKAPMKLDDVRAAVETIVGHHSMLRSRFAHGQGGWTQRILLEAADSYHFGHHNVSKNAEVEAIVERSEALIDIESGPVFAVEHFYTDDGQQPQQILYLIAHHLVVDLWSWRVIIKDLDELLHRGTLYSRHTMPYQLWIAAQEEEIESLDHDNVLPFPVVPGDHAYWGLEHADNTYEDTAEVGFRLSSEITTILQTACNAVFCTETVEIYLAALMLSFSQAFHDRSVPVIWNQEPGRESGSSPHDIAETVGWFTSLCPIASVLEGPGVSEGILDVLRRTKDMRRCIPDRGRGYFTSQMRDRRLGRFAMPWPFEIMFTYAGSTSQLNPGTDGVLEHLSLPGKILAARTGDIGPAVGRIALFEVSVMVDKGSARVKFIYNRQANCQNRITSWIHAYEHLLLETVGKLRYHKPELTLCDIRLPVNYDQLRKINGEVCAGLNLKCAKEMEDIFEVTAVQQDILVRQKAVPDSGLVSAVYQLGRFSGGELDVGRICASWQAVISKNPALRTVFIHSITDGALFDAVVLKKYAADMLFLDCREGEDPLAVMERLPGLKNTRESPRHRLSVCRMQGKAMLKLDISAALCDATSTKLLFSNLQSIYSSTAVSPSRAAQADTLSFSQAEYLDTLSAARCRPGILSPFKTMMRNIPPCIFPSLSKHYNKGLQHVSLYLPSPTPELVTHFAKDKFVSPEMVLRLAWALTLRTFTGQDKVSFGSRGSGRTLDVYGIDHAPGSFDTILPCVVDLPGYRLLPAALKSIQEHQIQCEGGHVLSLAEVLHSSRSIDSPGHQWGNDGRLFNTILLFDNEDVSKRPPAPSTSTRPNEATMTPITACETFDADLVLKVRFKDGKTTMDVSHRILNEPQAAQIANTFATAMSILIEDTVESVGSVDLFTDGDMAAVLGWETQQENKKVGFVHDLISEKCRKQPERIAVTGPDGELTYEQVEDLSGRLARELMGFGVKPAMPIPVVFGKSVWAIVAILGVLKAGASFSPFDADEQPSISRMVRTLGTNIIICSSSNQHTTELPPNVRFVVLNEETANVLPRGGFAKPQVSQSDPAFMLASLNSPREARGLVYSHSAATAAFQSQGPALGINSASRVMQLCALGVDIAVAEILTTLIAGGTICVPSASERMNDLAGSISRMRVTFTYLTPVLARRVDPTTLKTLKTVCFRTRSLDEGTLKPWVRAGIKALLAYGTPDVCPLGISVLEVDHSRKLCLVGRPSIGRFWVVARDDCRRLVPVGAIGDLVVDSPTLSTRFSLDKDKGSVHHRNHSRTLSSVDMVTSPSSLSPPTSEVMKRSATSCTTVPSLSRESGPGVCIGAGELQTGEKKTRYFRTGHGARFIEGGKVELLDAGESTTTNGHTVFLAEVEAAMRKCFGTGVDVVVDSVSFSTASTEAPSGANPKPERHASLVVFVELGSQFEGPEDLGQLNPKTCSRLAVAKKLVSGALPSYQVPEIFVPIKKIPVTPSLKVNRRKLHRMIEDMSKDDLLALSRAESPESGRPELKPLPLTRSEEHIRQIWARILNIPSHTIRAMDTFVHLGGDEVLAADAVMAARREGLGMPIGDLISGKTLADVSRACKLDVLSYSALVSGQEAVATDPEGHSPLSSPSLMPSAEFISSVLAPAVGVESPLEIKDCAIATTSQIRALEAGLSNEYANVDWLSLTFSGPVSSKSLEEACLLLATIHPILRTGFVVNRRSVWQVNLRNWTPEFKSEHAGWRLGTAVEKILRRDREQRETESIDFARPVTKFVFVQAGRSGVLLIRLSKAQYDSASFAVVLSDLKQLYAGTQNPPKRPTFCRYIRSMQTTEMARESQVYWRSLLDGASMTKIVDYKSPASPASTSSIRQRTPVGSLAALGLGFDTVVKSAWAMVLAALSASGDVVFGEAVDARSGPAGQWSAVVGPCANVIPVRVQFPNHKMSGIDLMHSVRAQREAGIAHEGSGWMTIVGTSTGWPYWTMFGSVVSVNTNSAVCDGDTVDFQLDERSGTTGRLQLLPGHEWHHTDLFLRVSLRGAFASVQIIYPESRVPARLVEQALGGFCAMMARLSSGPIMSPVVPGRADLEDLTSQIPIPVEVQRNATLRIKSPEFSPVPRSPDMMAKSAAIPVTGIAALASLATSVAAAAAAANATQVAPPPVTAPHKLPNVPNIASLSALASSSRLSPQLSTVAQSPRPTHPGVLATKTLAPETCLALQSLVMTAWTTILDPRRFGVPEQHLHTAAFFDLWGSLLPAAAMARYLTQELPKMELPIAATKNHGLFKPQKGSIKISMEEIIAHPSVLSQVDLLAKKLAPQLDGGPLRRKGSFVMRAGDTLGRGIRKLGISTTSTSSVQQQRQRHQPHHLTINTNINTATPKNAIRGGESPATAATAQTPMTGTTMPTPTDLLKVPVKHVTIVSPPTSGSVYSQPSSSYPSLSGRLVDPTSPSAGSRMAEVSPLSPVAAGELVGSSGTMGLHPTLESLRRGGETSEMRERPGEGGKRVSVVLPTSLFTVNRERGERLRTLSLQQQQQQTRQTVHISQQQQQHGYTNTSGSSVPVRSDSPTMPSFPELDSTIATTSSGFQYSHHHDSHHSSAAAGSPSPRTTSSENSIAPAPPPKEPPHLHLQVPDTAPFIPADIISPLSPMDDGTGSGGNVIRGEDSMESLTTGSSAESDEGGPAPEPTGRTTARILSPVTSPRIDAAAAFAPTPRTPPRNIAFAANIAKLNIPEPTPPPTTPSGRVIGHVRGRFGSGDSGVSNSSAGSGISAGGSPSSRCSVAVVAGSVRARAAAFEAAKLEAAQPRTRAAPPKIRTNARARFQSPVTPGAGLKGENIKVVSPESAVDRGNGVESSLAAAVGTGGDGERGKTNLKGEDGVVGVGGLGVVGHVDS